MPRAVRSNVEWAAWGDPQTGDPFFGVASLDGRNRRGSHPWTADEFYRHGEETWRIERPRWERYGVVRDACVEIGCGAGRMTNQLAGYFSQVHGCDVSEGMLSVARTHVRKPNITFHLIDTARLPLADESVTAAFSSDVFQHFSSTSVAEDYFAEIYRVMAHGSTMMIHLPIVVWPNQPRRLLRRLHTLWHLGYSAITELRRWAVRRRWISPFMYGIVYDRTELFEVLGSIGFTDIQVLYPNHRSYLFARKN